MTTSDRKEEIAKYGRPKVTGMEYLLFGSVSRQVSTTSPNMKII